MGQDLRSACLEVGSDELLNSSLETTEKGWCDMYIAVSQAS